MNEISKYLTSFILKNINFYQQSTKNWSSSTVRSGKNVSTPYIEPLNSSHEFIQKIQEDIFIANEKWKSFRDSSKRSIEENTFYGERPNGIRNKNYSTIPKKIRSIIESQPFFNFSSTLFLNNSSEKSIEELPNTKITVYLHYFLSPNDSQIINPNKINKYFQKCMQKIFIWFYIANKYKLNVCSKNLSVYLYLTNTPKLIPENGERLDIDYVNTGFTYACLPNDTPNEIYIFREEEWFKVLIHETIHSFGMEFSTHQNIENYANKKIIDLFSLPEVSIENVYGSGYNIFESYTEITAEIMNILIYQFLHGGELSKLFKVEQLFSCFQCAKMVLFSESITGNNFTNFSQQPTEKGYSSILRTDESINLSTLHSKKFIFGSGDASPKNVNSLTLRSGENVNKPLSKKPFIFTKYTEKTNIFSYFILKSMLLFDINSYMDWVMNYNKGSLNFIKTMENIESYIKLIQQTSSSPRYLRTFFKMKNWLEQHKKNDSLEVKTIRMTVLEY